MRNNGAPLKLVMKKMHRHAASTYINKGEIKILQTLHKTLHSLCISLIIRVLHCVGFEAKILHEPCTELYILEHELNTN